MEYMKTPRVQITLSLNIEEYKALEILAQKEGVTKFSEYIRQIVTEKINTTKKTK